MMLNKSMLIYTTSLPNGDKSIKNIIYTYYSRKLLYMLILINDTPVYFTYKLRSDHK